MTTFIPRTETRPSPKQALFLGLPHREAFFGGAAGGGKSEALLMGALQWVDTPGYAGLLLRRTFRDLELPGSLIPRSHEWLSGTEAHWRGDEYLWLFPSGARLQFGYIQHPGDEQQYRSAEFQYVGFDELTTFEESMYRFLFSRLRRNTGLARAGVPLRMRSASNPGGIGHDWVQRHFLDFPTEDAIFIPSKLTDNPGLDQEAYLEALAYLDDVTLAQLRDGDWSVRPTGGRFDRHWLKADHLHTELPKGHEEWRWVRYWDLAASEEKPGKDPDYTVGTLLGLDEQNEPWVADVTRFRRDPGDTEDIIKAVAQTDAMHLENVSVRMEQEPGSAGEIVIDHYAKQLRGFPFDGIRSTGKKEVRALPFSTAMRRGFVHVVMAEWWSDWVNELEAFPTGAHDDQVDSSAGAYNHLARHLFEPGGATVGGAVKGLAANPAQGYHARRRSASGYRRLTGGG